MITDLKGGAEDDARTRATNSVQVSLALSAVLPPVRKENLK